MTDTPPKVCLVDNWRSAWKWVSMNCMAAAAAVQLTWASIDPDMRATIPHWVVSGLTIGLLAFGMIGRMFKQDHNEDCP